MNLNQVIELYKKGDLEAITSFENHIEEKDVIQFSEIIEIPYPENFQVDIITSIDKKNSIIDFLFSAMKQLEYEPIEEFPEYEVQNYTFENTIHELSSVEAKDFLIVKTSQNNILSIFKLKEKDELTFLIVTELNYVFISEIYWKS